MGIINRYLIIGLAGVVAILVAVCGVLWLTGKAARAERDLARVNYDTAITANGTLFKSIAAERAEKERIAGLLAERIDAQKKIELEAAERLRKKDRELAELRKAYEEVDAYLSVPVPSNYLNWLRGQTVNNPD